MAYKIAGESKWWQVRAGPGVEAEWIVMKKDWREYSKYRKERDANGADGEKRRDDEGMVGEDGGVDENGGCELLLLATIALIWGFQSGLRWTSYGVCFPVSFDT